MIIVKIQGGLGNQLFQFALALALKTKNPNEKIGVDLTYYKTKNKRITERKSFIHAFNIDSFPEATFKELNKTNPLQTIKKLFSKEKKILIINENSTLFLPSILSCDTNTFLNGYWQSYKYFEEINSVIKKQFSLKISLSVESEEQKKIILKTPTSIGIHIRRGDYLSKYSEIYNQLNLDYYYKGVAYVQKNLNVEKISLFLFSDDIEWCKQNFKTTEEVYFIENASTKPDYEDLSLMSYCTHNIIANSSYSWWGAWLNTNENKIIIAPSKWYNNQEPDFNKSIYPSTWTVL
ncbi:MAG: alpha-1,2-fucosyltransferase [Bacteroidota bacterium]|nr:alpha-1,2-fucosyltransferase [Bacteroidota bacterium]MDP3144475.1 alpha-1,2-fucosyltransferase [Bacteroidota bacterium]